MNSLENSLLGCVKGEEFIVWESAGDSSKLALTFVWRTLQIASFDDSGTFVFRLNDIPSIQRCASNLWPGVKWTNFVWK